MGKYKTKLSYYLSFPRKRESRLMDSRAKPEDDKKNKKSPAPAELRRIGIVLMRAELTPYWATEATALRRATRSCSHQASLSCRQTRSHRLIHLRQTTLSMPS